MVAANFSPPFQSKLKNGTKLFFLSPACLDGTSICFVLSVPAPVNYDRCSPNGIAIAPMRLMRRCHGLRGLGSIEGRNFYPGRIDRNGRQPYELREPWNNRIGRNPGRRNSRNRAVFQLSGCPPVRAMQPGGGMRKVRFTRVCTACRSIKPGLSTKVWGERRSPLQHHKLVRRWRARMLRIQRTSVLPGSLQNVVPIR